MLIQSESWYFNKSISKSPNKEILSKDSFCSLNKNGEKHHSFWADNLYKSWFNFSWSFRSLLSWQESLLLIKRKVSPGHISVFVFFSCYLAAPWAPLGHSQGDSINNLMFITAFKLKAKLNGSLVTRLYL